MKIILLAMLLGFGAQLSPSWGGSPSTIIRVLETEMGRRLLSTLMGMEIGADIAPAQLYEFYQASLKRLPKYKRETLEESWIKIASGSEPDTTVQDLLKKIFYGEAGKLQRPSLNPSLEEFTGTYLVEFANNQEGSIFLTLNEDGTFLYERFSLNTIATFNGRATLEGSILTLKAENIWGETVLDYHIDLTAVKRFEFFQAPLHNSKTEWRGVADFKRIPFAN